MKVSVYDRRLLTHDRRKLVIFSKPQEMSIIDTDSPDLTVTTITVSSQVYSEMEKDESLRLIPQDMIFIVGMSCYRVDLAKKQLLFI